MSKHHPSPKFRRFVANVKDWTVHCSRCPRSENISTNKARPLPPEIIIKKLARLGWRIDTNPKNDLCPDCIRKPIQAALPLASKALDDMNRPMVKVVVANGIKGCVHFTELCAVARTLGPDEARQLIDILKDRIPQKPKRSREQDDPDYAQWLAQVSK